MANETSILAVIVLYRQLPNESAAWRSLRNAVGHTPEALRRFAVILYDNSPSGAGSLDLPAYAGYHSDVANAGLAGAYNFGLKKAEAGGFEWLLTMDQDTELPENFLERLGEYGCAISARDEIAVIAPQLLEGKVLLSPRSVHAFRTKAVPLGFRGVRREEVHAFNSGTLWRVTALRQIGGFSYRFPLDHLDIYMHRQLHRAAFRTYIAGDVQLQHSLSLLDYKNRVTVDRYRHFLAAESAFCDLYQSPLQGLLLTSRLCFRLRKQKRRGETREIQRLTIEAIRRRLFESRARRIEQRILAIGKPAEDLSSEERPRVSVCMAALNGELYIGTQLRSILDQLAARDEVVIVDDGSSDGTCDMVAAIGDKRIRLVRHESNVGVLRTFEHAIREAQGEFLFLADQDDLWAPDKVASVLQAFAENPAMDVAVSDASLIDEQDNVIGDSYYAVRGSFRSGVLSNLLRCKYLGCTMAFRRRLCGRILPFPANADILHDVWIGVANSISGGKTLYLNRPLVQYRRHGNNATGISRLSFARRIRIRWDLCLSLVRRWAQLHGRR